MGYSASLINREFDKNHSKLPAPVDTSEAPHRIFSPLIPRARLPRINWPFLIIIISTLCTVRFPISPLLTPAPFLLPMPPGAATSRAATAVAPLSILLWARRVAVLLAVCLLPFLLLAVGHALGPEVVCADKYPEDLDDVDKDAGHYGHRLLYR
jgi:hypothetical protein